jgi:hypothetical protein
MAQATENKTLAIDANNGWRYYPAVKDGAVIGLLCEQTTGESPTGYSVLWHKRLSNGTWSTEGWKESVQSAAALITIGNGGVHFRKATLPSVDEGGGCSTTSLNPVNPGLIHFEYGLAVSDPLAPIAPYLDPQTIESLVAAGASGAIGVSGMAVAGNDPSGLTVSLDMFLEDLRILSQNFVTNDDPLLGQARPSCAYVVTVVTTVVNIGVPVVSGPNLCGECKYTQQAVTYIDTCTTETNCLTECVVTTSTAPVVTTAPAVNGQCP